jgi:transposase-like protein
MRHFSAAYKRRIVEEAARCQVGEVGAMLRREGLYSSALTRWRNQYAAGVLAGCRSRHPVTSPGRRVLWPLTWHGWSGRTDGYNGSLRRPN